MTHRWSRTNKYAPIEQRVDHAVYETDAEIGWWFNTDWEADEDRDVALFNAYKIGLRRARAHALRDDAAIADVMHNATKTVDALIAARADSEEP